MNLRTRFFRLDGDPMQHSSLARSLPFSLSALAIAASLALTACPGRITDPSPFIGGNNEGGTAGCSIASTQIESQLIRPRCATTGCHDRSTRAGSLDLQSPDIGPRLLGQTSTCMGRPLIDPANRSGSYFISKVADGTPTCGARMPLGAPPFNASEIACVRTWVSTLGQNPMTDSGVPTDTGVPADTGVPRPDASMDAMSQPDTGVRDTGVDSPSSM
ncbi:MAG: hypothetical protein U0269_37490, partial [Polyangiales bacterium]